MVIHFPSWLKRKREKEAGITDEDKRYVYSHPAPPLPHEIEEQEREREDYIQSVTSTSQFDDYCQIETFGDRQKMQRKKTVWDKLMVD